MRQILEIINEMSPFLLLGFLLAGIMHAFIPSRAYGRFLSQNNFRSVLNAAIFGIPLPLCSCGVLPTAMSLRKEGASKGAVTSFLVATPQTGIDSIIATYSLMGLPFAITRPIAALVTSLFAGQMVNVFDKTDDTNDNNTQHIEKECAADDASKKKPFLKRCIEALEYAFVEMMSDIGKWLVIGLVVAGLITVLVPDSFFEIFSNNSLLSMLLVLCISVPMYICATGSIPIAVALMLKGLTPGAGLVLLMAGPAANVASMLVIKKVLGTRTMLIYLFSIIIGAMAFGLGIDNLLPREWFTSSLVANADCCNETISIFNWACTILLAILLLNAWLRNRGHKHSHNIEASDEKDAIVFHIEGMNCNHCRMNAEKALRQVPGVKDASVDLASKEARITGNPDIEELRKALSEIGFTLVP
ncbi:MAG: SO_0444 family Cu/Zn efflux transporter [Candidatus Limimorpha sp.]